MLAFGSPSPPLLSKYVTLSTSVVWAIAEPEQTNITKATAANITARNAICFFVERILFPPDRALLRCFLNRWLPWFTDGVAPTMSAVVGLNCRAPARQF